MEIPIMMHNIDESHKGMMIKDEMLGNKSFDIIQTLQTEQILENHDEDQAFHHLWSQQQQKGQPKKREVNRVQKLMSYLEGDSLLKEIEKSIEQEALEIEDYQQERMVGEEDQKEEDHEAFIEDMEEDIPSNLDGTDTETEHFNQALHISSST